ITTWSAEPRRQGDEQMRASDSETNSILPQRALRHYSLPNAKLIAEALKRSKRKERGYIEKLHSIADLVGGNFAGRLFITSQCAPKDSSGLQAYKAFCEQARARQVVIVTGEQLKALPEILRRESGDKPKYSYF